MLGVSDRALESGRTIAAARCRRLAEVPHTAVPLDLELLLGMTKENTAREENLVLAATDTRRVIRIKSRPLPMWYHSHSTPIYMILRDTVCVVKIKWPKVHFPLLKYIKIICGCPSLPVILRITL